MKTLFTLILTSALVLGTGATATAGTPRINARERTQQKRIAKGVASGELTAREVLVLETQQARVRAREARAKSDGVVTAAERVRLHRALNRTSRSVHARKHD